MAEKRDSQNSERNSWQNAKFDRSSFRGERVFYRGGGARRRYVPRQSGVKTVDFSLPVSNPFGPLAHCNETQMRQNLENASSASNSKKHPLVVTVRRPTPDEKAPGGSGNSSLGSRLGIR